MFRRLVPLVLLLAGLGLAQSKPNLLEQKMGWCVGDWRATGNGPDGKPVTVDVSTRWSENRQALIFNVWFTTEGVRVPAYTGMYVWHPAKQQPVLYQVNDEGVVTEGAVRWQGDLQLQDNEGVKAPGQTFATHTETRREGNDAYDWRAFLDKDGKPVEVLHLHYVRVK